MCICPNFVWVLRGPKWEQQPVACRQCWRCRQNRVNDYVARALAEASVSEVSCTVSLTYAPRDDLADKVLQPRDFQLFMKLLRRAGHKVRYLVAGEYGDLKGRAHFHAILFFQHLAQGNGIVPGYQTFDAAFSRQIPHKRMVHIREWPHGHISVDWSASEKSARYVCKYLLADDKNNAWFSLSKKPALGAAWFAQKAAKAREFGVLPSSFEYLPPGGDREKPYLMTGATRRDFMNAITQDEHRRSRMGEWVQKTFDKLAAERRMSAAEGMPLEHKWQRLVECLADREHIGDNVYLSQQRKEAWAEFLAGAPFDEWQALQWGFHDAEEFQGFVLNGGLEPFARAFAWREHDEGRQDATPVGGGPGACGSEPDEFEASVRALLGDAYVAPCGCRVGEGCQAAVAG